MITALVRRGFAGKNYVNRYVVEESLSGSCNLLIWGREWELNPQPPLYESGALPLSYPGV